MKTLSTLTTLVASGALAVSIVGCAYRSPEMYRDDTAKVIAAKNGDIKACYDGILQKTPTAAGKVTVNFEVETEVGKIQNVAVDTANTTAPAELGECVKKAIDGLVVNPPDRKLGQATFVYDFAPGAPPPAPAPAAAPAAAPKT